MIEIFTISFIVAMTGAIVPGQVLTFTIYKSLKSEKGYLAGLLIVMGHAALEFSLIILLLFGASLFFQNLVFLIAIGFIGGSCLLVFGILVIKDVYKQKYEISFAISEHDIKGFKGNSFIGGIFYSIINPYWVFWWAAVGLKLMIDLDVSFANPIGLLLFFLGHEFGDLIWYVPISVFVYFGGRSLNPKVYKYILVICGAFMIFLGVIYLTRTFISM